jgi:hypothetical protein
MAMQNVATGALRLALTFVLASSACTADVAGEEPSSEHSNDGGEDAATASGGGGGSGGSAVVSGGGTGGILVSGGAGGTLVDAAVPDAAHAEPDAAHAEDDASTVSDAGVGPLPNQTCLEGVIDFVARGPYAFEATEVGSVKVWVPDLPFDCKPPVVHFANGTGAACSTYASALEHLASHGFFTACYESTQTGKGTQCIDAVEALYEEYRNRVSTQQIGFTGNGTGGGAALVCAYRAEEKWGNTKLLAAHAVPPDLAGVLGGWREIYDQIDSPVFLMNGSVDGAPTDGLVSESSVRDVYVALNDDVEAYWYEGLGAAHIPVPTAFIEESAVAWFRWKLLGDAAACQHFRAMPEGDRWNLQEQQNAVTCE